MTGVLAAISGGANNTTGDFSGSLVCGSSPIETGSDPKTGTPIMSTANGFGLGEPTYGNFGSLSSSGWRGFPIVGMYQADSNGDTILELSGDATALSPVLTVGGVNQNLGAGALAGGITTFTTSGAIGDPFTGTKAVSITG